MKKKVVAMLLAGIMAAGALAGCGGSSDSGQGGSAGYLPLATTEQPL